MSNLNPLAQSIVNRLAAIDYSQQRYSEERITQAFRDHLQALNQPDRPVRIVYSFQEGVGAAWDAAWGAARGAAWDAAWGAARGAARGAAWGAAWGAARGAARDAAWGAARGAARDAAWGAAWGAARDAAWDAARDAARGAARDAAWDAARDAARGAARDAAWGATWGAAIANSTDHDPRHSGWMAIWMPFVDAIDAGLFAYWITPDEIIAVIQPVMRIQDGQLHADGQPAVDWGTERYYFWRGVQVPEKYGSVYSEQWNAEWLLHEDNAELRRGLIQGIGYDRICQELNAQEVDSWREYSLLEIDAEVDLESIRLLKMTCPSTGYIHALRVPPNIDSARECIRWVNWGVDPEEIVVES